jgi:hypothetical protein
MWLCGVRVAYLNTGQSYSIAQTVERSYFGGEVHTDGRRVVWTDGRAKQAANEPAVANANDNTDIYYAHLSDFAHAEVVTAPGRQWDAQVAGSIVAWSDCRAARDAEDWNACDIYMRNLDTRVETRITSARGEQRRPHTDGKYIVY